MVVQWNCLLPISAKSGGSAASSEQEPRPPASPQNPKAPGYQYCGSLGLHRGPDGSAKNGNLLHQVQSCLGMMLPNVWPVSAAFNEIRYAHQGR